MSNPYHRRSLYARTSGPMSYMAPQPTRFAPIPPSKAMPAGTTQAVVVTPVVKAMPTGATKLTTPSGPPDWYLKAHDAIDEALLSSVRVVSLDSKSNSERNVLYLDRMTEYLRAWESDLQDRANMIRKIPVVHGTTRPDGEEPIGDAGTSPDSRHSPPTSEATPITWQTKVAAGGALIAVLSLAWVLIRA